MNIRWGLRALAIMAFSLSASLAVAHEGHEHGTADPGVRMWTFDDTGAHVHASYVASTNGKVQVRRSDGKLISLEIARLTETDQRWIAQKAVQVRQLYENLRPRDMSMLVATKAMRKPDIADSFEPFAKRNALKYRRDAQFFYVESNSMPAHRMMVGITAWQQQVPIPQPYFGNNAWRIPLEPTVAEHPLSAKSHFFRGAIALAANGVPIFNPIKNDGRTDTLIAGELDEFGGHCGRADDYHYHIAPTHLQEIVGKNNPIAYALDGYPIYGYTEPDGSKVAGLNEFNGHSSPELGYHYHATKTYPYLNGGFHGVVVQRDGQVDPQPRAGGVREALPPLRGAKITGFESKDAKYFSLKVEVGRETRYVNYVLSENGSVRFDFVDGNGQVKSETYSRRQRGPGGGAGEGSGRPGGGPGGPRGGGNDRVRDNAGAGGREDKPPPAGGNRDGRGRANENRRDGRPQERPENDRGNASAASAAHPMIIHPPQSGNFKLTSPAFVEGQPLPDAFNGNGEGVTPPLEWTGAPAGTKSFALVMDHLDRDNVMKTYWNLYDIPPKATRLEKNVKGIGKVGATWKREQAYVPPHSSGGGKQIYTIHIYALSTVPEFDEKDGRVTREALLAQIKDKILDSAELSVTYQRPAGEQPAGQGDRGAERGGEQGKAKGKGNGGSGLGNYTEPPAANNVPVHLYNIVLGRPTDSSITIRPLFQKPAHVFVEYGLASDKLTQKTPPALIGAKGTHDFVLHSLIPNSRYYYKLVYETESGDQQSTNVFSFQTQRDPECSFVFTITSDSHLDENTSGEVYLRTLANALSDSPDFHFELGDTFMTGKYVKPELAEPQYLAQRYYLGSLCHSAPLFFALGNHDGESGSRGSSAWATRTRKRLFPNPQPDQFYTGNDQSDPDIGLPEDYYQWTWGDAQFIVLDPFRYTTQRSRDGNNWAWTLGDHQYRWLKASLEGSDAKYRFVFLHHLVGGSSANNRGGVEVAELWEWGGKGRTGENEFAKYRPGWEMPIHDLLVKHGVSIVFHGHDHLFIKQDLDGIVYQEVPQPGHPRSGNTNTAKEYGYLSGETQSSSGFIRVRVGSDSTRVDYVRTYLPAAESQNKRNGDVSFSYVVPSRQTSKPR